MPRTDCGYPFLQHDDRDDLSPTVSLPITPTAHRESPAEALAGNIDGGAGATTRTLRLQPDRRFSPVETFAPVSWSAGRWPNEDWIDGAFWWVGRVGGQTVWRRLAGADSATTLVVAGDAPAAQDAAWFARLCKPPSIGEEGWTDPTVGRLASRYRGAWTFCYGTLFDGVVASIVGQSISLAAAGVTAARLAARFHPGVRLAGRTFWPLPSAADLADADPTFVRQSGVTTKRAEALCAVGRLCADLDLPDVPDLPALAALELAMLDLSGIGPWTVASSLLWGIGHPDAFPHGDVALLRAARHCYVSSDLDMKGLNSLSEAWRPYRGEAARLLWLDLFGPAPGAS